LSLRDALPPNGAAEAPEIAFQAPWQAHAFALVLALHQQGAFTWAEWTDSLGCALLGRTDDEADSYYVAWLAALERIVCGHGLASPTALAARKTAWAEAYLRTPHGQPVTL